MAELRVCIGDVKKGRTYQKVLNEKEADSFRGLKIGEKIKGEGFGMSGYELLITGGSDHCGFPMRRGIDSTGRVKIYATGGVGIKKGRKGNLTRKSVAGAIIGGKTTQVNLKVLAYGKKSVAECFGVEEKKKEEKPKEIKEDKKEVIKEEKKPSAGEIVEKVSEEIKEEKIKEEERKKEKEAKKVPSAAELAEKKKEGKNVSQKTEN